MSGHSLNMVLYGILRDRWQVRRPPAVALQLRLGGQLGDRDGGPAGLGDARPVAAAAPSRRRVPPTRRRGAPDVSLPAADTGPLVELVVAPSPVAVDLAAQEARDTVLVEHARVARHAETAHAMQLQRAGEGPPTRSDIAHPEGLPPGWEEALSRTTGEVYYVHVATGRSQYARPGEVEAEAEEFLRQVAAEVVQASWRARCVRKRLRELRAMDMPVEDIRFLVADGYVAGRS